MWSKDTASKTPAPKHRNAEITRGHLCREGNAIDRIPKTKVIAGSAIVATNLAFVTLSILKNLCDCVSSYSNLSSSLKFNTLVAQVPEN
jgi:hypothetical protein